jgi:hypothetical protein
LGGRGGRGCGAEPKALAPAELLDDQVEELVHLVLVVAAADQGGRVELDLLDLLGGERVLAGQRGLHPVEEVVDLVLVVAATAK